MSQSGAQHSPNELHTVGDFDPESDRAIEFDFVGRLIAGRYTIRAHVGGGGMADVFQATDEQLAACSSGDGPGSGPIDLGTSIHSPGSTSLETPTTSVTMTGTAGSTATGPSSDTTSSGNTSTSNTSTSETTGGPSGSTSEGPSPSCGDGELDPGEECDLSAAINDDNGACTLDCKLARCGDKLIWAGHEACDDGPNNNDTVYGGCTNQCELGARCNDGELQGPEECDLGDDNGTGEFPANGVPCDDGCRFDAKLAFISSVAYKGGDIGGAEGAHQKCQALASAAAFDNAVNFKAWISDPQHSPAKDFSKTPGKPYVRPDGFRIADDWSDLTANGPDEGIIITEAGTKLMNWGVWTGTAADGQLHPDTSTCKGWTSSDAADKGIRGLSGVDKQQAAAWLQWIEERQWTSYASLGCLQAYHLYCVEQ